MREFMYNIDDYFKETIKEWTSYLNVCANTKDVIQLKMVKLLKEIKILTFKVNKTEFKMDYFSDTRFVKKIIINWREKRFTLTTKDSNFLNEEWNVDGQYCSYYEYECKSFESVFNLSSLEADMLRKLIRMSAISAYVRHYDCLVNYNKEIMKLPKEIKGIIAEEQSRREYLKQLDKKKIFLQRKALLIGVINAPIIISYTFLLMNYRKQNKKSVSSKLHNIAIKPLTLNFMKRPFKNVTRSLDKIESEIKLINAVETQQKFKAKKIKMLS